MVQWLRLHVPNAGARVQSLVRALDATAKTRHSQIQERQRERGRKKERRRTQMEGSRQEMVVAPTSISPGGVRRLRFWICLELSCADRPDRSSDARRQGKDSFRMFSLSNRKGGAITPCIRRTAGRGSSMSEEPETDLREKLMRGPNRAGSGVQRRCLG